MELKVAVSVIGAIALIAVLYFVSFPMLKMAREMKKQSKGEQ